MVWLIDIYTGSIPKNTVFDSRNQKKNKTNQPTYKIYISANIRNRK